MQARATTGSARRRRVVVAGAVTLACVLAGAILVAARASSLAADAQASIEQILGLPGAYTFISPDPATVWELHRRGGDDDEDRDEPRATATGASVTFDLPVRDREATSYEIRSADRTWWCRRR